METYKPSFIRSVIDCTCPKCRIGHLFVNTNHYNFSSLLEMPSKCENCGQDFEIEPGFYLGAMWVSYPFVIGFEILFLVFGLFVLQFNWFYGFSFATFLLLLISPLILRLGRSLFIHLNVSFEG